MTDEQTIIDADAYTGTHRYLADFVQQSPSPQLGAALVLNAAFEIYWDVHGQDAFEAALRQALESAPARAAKMRNQLA